MIKKTKICSKIILLRESALVNLCFEKFMKYEKNNKYFFFHIFNKYNHKLIHHILRLR